jgi:thiol:disulfide interchange protein
MKNVLSQTVAFFFMLLLFTANTYASQINSKLPVYSRIYDETRNPNADGRAALQLAKETQRKVLIEVGGDWCSWCHVLDRFIKDNPAVEKRLQETFVVLKVNISDANDNAEFMSAFPPALGYPHMYITDSSGNILHSQDTSEFWENKQYSEKRFMIFFDRWENHNE